MKTISKILVIALVAVSVNVNASVKGDDKNNSSSSTSAAALTISGQVVDKETGDQYLIELNREIQEVLTASMTILDRMKSDYSALIGKEVKIEYEINQVKPYCFMDAVKNSLNAQKGINVIYEKNLNLFPPESKEKVELAIKW